jgi:hypothetical protein
MVTPLGPDGPAEVDVDIATVPIRIATKVMPVTDARCIRNPSVGS